MRHDQDGSMDDIELNKREIIARCIRRIHEERTPDPQAWRTNLTKQDSVILNIQRACEAAIDLAMHRVRQHKLGIPQAHGSAVLTLPRYEPPTTSEGVRTATHAAICSRWDCFIARIRLNCAGLWG